MERRTNCEVVKWTEISRMAGFYDSGEEPFVSVTILHFVISSIQLLNGDFYHSLLVKK